MVVSSLFNPHCRRNLIILILIPSYNFESEKKPHLETRIPQAPFLNAKPESRTPDSQTPTLNPKKLKSEIRISQIRVPNSNFEPENSKVPIQIPKSNFESDRKPQPQTRISQSGYQTPTLSPKKSKTETQYDDYYYKFPKSQFQPPALIPKKPRPEFTNAYQTSTWGAKFLKLIVGTAILLV